MKVLCKKNNKSFKKGKWYDAIIQDLKFLDISKKSGVETKTAYLIGNDKGYRAFYLETQKKDDLYSEYFYTNQEIRKEKIKQLSEK